MIQFKTVQSEAGSGSSATFLVGKNEATRRAQLEKMVLDGKITKVQRLFMDEKSVAYRTVLSQSRRYYGAPGSTEYENTLQICGLFTEYHLPATQKLTLDIYSIRDKRHKKSQISYTYQGYVSETYFDFRGTVRRFKGNMNKLTKTQILKFAMDSRKYLEYKNAVYADARPNTVKAAQISKGTIEIKSKYKTARIDAVFGGTNKIIAACKTGAVKEYATLENLYEQWITENGFIEI